jgi:alkanesulfonate monooxygenase SsuD/methylene tetrahydromethanopterin reductase-like flavin-dependent oxidoreductase (luciferase family)
MAVKFGVMTPQQGLTLAELKGIWQEIERLGFDSVWLVDHFLPYFPDPYNRQLLTTAPVMESWSLLAALSQATKRIRIGPLVTCNSYRSPSLLAKISSTVDVISGGRLNFGIGAGWYAEEHRCYGFPFESFHSRTERLVESVQLVKLMWTRDEASFEGKYYRIENAVNEPKPIQKPRPPIWIGAEGDTMLTIAAQLADVWNFPSDMHFYSAEEYAAKIRKFERACQDCERASNEIVKSWLGIALLDRHKDKLKQKIGQLKPAEVSLDRYLESVVGSPSECAKKLRVYTKLGVSYFVLVFPDLPDLQSARIFAEDVMSTFQ